MTQRIDNRTRRREPTERTATFTAFGLAAEAKPLSPGLYVVATPIGNLQDVSFRALSVLAAADAVLAEDTRVTKTLLAHYGITTPLVAYHEHSNDAVRERMVHRIREGQALGPGLRCRHAARVGSRLQARAGGDRGRASGHARSPAPPPCSPRSWPRACRRTASSSKASCRRRAPRGARGWPRSARFPARSCCSRARTACPKCWRTPPRCWANGRPWWRAN